MCRLPAVQLQMVVNGRFPDRCRMGCHPILAYPQGYIEWQVKRCCSRSWRLLSCKSSELAYALQRLLMKARNLHEMHLALLVAKI